MCEDVNLQLLLGVIGMWKTRIWLLSCVVLILIGALLIWRPWAGASAEGGKQEVAAPDRPVGDAIAATPINAVIPVVGLTDEAKAMLEKNGFVVVAEKVPFWRIDRFYDQCKGERQPILVTSDSMLHVSHLVFDWYLRFLETAHLRSDLINLTDSGIAMSMAYWDQSGSPLLKDAALRNATYFYVAKALLGEAKLSEAPENLRRKIEGEIKLIEQHAGFAQSPLFGCKEDYSQYVPRGHYARSPELSSYFKAMMWYGRMTMRLKSEHLSTEEARRETVQALLVCKALLEGRAKGERTLDVWKRIEHITSFFAGKADDLTPEEYIPLAQQVFGSDLPLASLGDTKQLDRFVGEASKLRKPGILSTFWAATYPEDWQTGTQGFRLMGQRFTFDSYMFQQLVFDKVGKWQGRGAKPFTLTNAQGFLVRGFPRGLDILAAMGSDDAKTIIEKEGDAAYAGYSNRLAELRRKSSDMPKPANLYDARLALLREVIGAPEAGAPTFMRSPAWTRKSLSSALGSWTELKHDTCILYGKQSYTLAQAAFATMGKGGPIEEPKPVHGYVEPCPRVYAAIRAAVAQLHARLLDLGFPPDRGLESNLTRLEDLLGSLQVISSKELAGQPVTDDEQELIENFGSELQYVMRCAHYVDVTKNFMSGMEGSMPIVADVHTDVNSGMVLEKGVGYPLAIYVKAPVDGKPTVCKGAVYSCYEFKQPMSDRLTDESWRDMLDAKKNPGLPAWTDTYIPRASK